MGKTNDNSKPATADKAAQRVEKAADTFMDRAEKIADKYANKLDKAEAGTEDKVSDKFDAKMDKAADKLTDKVNKIVDKSLDKGELDASEDQDAAVFHYGGEASALGKDTFTLVESTSKVVDEGHVTTAKIDIKATAVAEGGSTYASAYTDVESDVDISLLIKFEEGILVSDGVSYDISDAKYIGINLPAYLDLPNGPKNKVIIIEHDGDPDLDAALDGNVAMLSFSADAQAENTLLTAEAHVMAMEDTMSISAIDIISAVG